MFEQLKAANFQVEFHSHAEAILAGDFPTVESELESVLLSATVPIEEIIAGGGGEAKGTQRLRRGLQAKDWKRLPSPLRSGSMALDGSPSVTRWIT